MIKKLISFSKIILSYCSLQLNFYFLRFYKRYFFSVFFLLLILFLI